MLDSRFAWKSGRLNLPVSEDDGKGQNGVTLSRAVCEGLGSLCFETDENGKIEGDSLCFENGVGVSIHLKTQISDCACRVLGCGG